MRQPALRRAIRLVVVCLLLLHGPPAAAQQTQLRPLTPDDLLRLEEIGDVALSPDGERVAYVVKRPAASASSFKWDFLAGNDRADVWLVPASGGTPRRLTDGYEDGAGFWAPTWSPGGSRLALLSTRGGNVTLWIWSADTGRLAQVTNDAVDAPFTGAGIVWINEAELICPLLPKGERPMRMTVERRAAEVAMEEWPKAWKGNQSTASVIESGVRLPFEKRPQGRLVRLDVTAGRETTLASGFFRELTASPDRRHVAFLEQTDVVKPEAGQALQHTIGERYGAGIVETAGHSVRDVDGIGDVTAGTLRWAPDGRALALIARPADRPAPASAYRVSVRQSPATRIELDDREATAVAWAGDHLLVLARPSETDEPQKDRRPDWYVAATAGDPRPLTSTLKTAPPAVYAQAGASAVVGLIDGDVWRIPLDGGAPRNLTGEFAQKIASVQWPSGPAAQPPELTRLIVGVEEGLTLALHQLDLGSGAVSKIPVPRPEASIAALDPGFKAAALIANDRTGTYLWTTSRGFQAASLALETNTFLRDIAGGAIRKFEYRSLDGQDLKGWLILPPTYQEGTKAPVVTWVYAGSMARQRPSRLAELNMPHPLNLQLYAARGYAVLLPSMPLPPEGRASDPYLELTKGVLPAVDKAIELGIADPDRLAVVGQSYGGYSTYGLITQTRRFKAAIALAGLSDLVSLYGVFDARSRYDRYPHDRLFSMSISESGQTRMGAPPWRDIGRYYRNSPLSYVERVETPLLIIQGDMDYVALQQGEQFFTALYRQGKRARFVRYWGEGHVLNSPANIRDMWERIYAWLAEFLEEEPTEKN